MSDAARQRVALGELIGTTLHTFGRCFVPFLAMGWLVLGPRLVLWDWIAPADDNSWGRNLGAMSVDFLVGSVLTGVLTLGVDAHLRGERMRFLPWLEQGVRTLPRVLGTSFVCLIRIAFASLLFLAPGIFEAVRLYVAVPASATEGRRAYDATQRSVELTHGSRATLFGAILLVNVGYFGLLLLLWWALDQAGLDSQGDRETWTYWFHTAAIVPLDVFAATMPGVAWFLLRRQSENVDARVVAAVFD